MLSSKLLQSLFLLPTFLTVLYANQTKMDPENHYVVEAIDGPACDLGEGPHWHDAQSSLYYVDAFKGVVHRYQANEKTHSSVSLGDLVTIVIPIEGHEELLVSLRNKVIKLNWNNKTHSVIAEVAAERNGKERFNDGKIDPNGCLWIGTVLQDDKGTIVPGGGSLYKLQGSSFVKMSENFTISNGMAWNRNSTIMYFNDSEDRKTYVFDFDVTNSTIKNKRILLDYSKHPELFGPKEYPDGMTIDDDQMLWISLYGGARIIRLNPQTGKLLASIPVPAPQTTSVSFGGPNFSELYVTTGDGDVKGKPELEKKYPNAGKIFKVTRKPQYGALKGLKALNFKL